MIYRSSVRSRHASGEGFTLLELMLVLFILGLVTAMAGIAISKSIDRSVGRREAQRLYQTMRQARQLSLTERVPYSVSFERGGNSYHMERMGRKSTESSGTINLSAGYELGGEPVVFYPMGTSTGGTVSIRDRDGGGYDIAVDPVTAAARIKRVQPN